MPMSPRLLRPRATGFNPRSISGLQLWLDASDSQSVLLATGVSEWSDKSGNNRNFVQPTANNQPLYSGTLNGKKVITFDGTNDVLTRSVSANSSLADTTGAAVFVVFCPSSDPEYSVFVNSSASFNGHRDRFFDNTTYAATFRNARFNGVASGVLPTNAACVYSHAVSVARNTHELRVNGAVLYSESVSFSLWRDQVSLTYQIGSGPNNDFLNGVIAEIVLYGRELTSSEVAAAERGLGRKWGITVA